MEKKKPSKQKDPDGDQAQRRIIEAEETLHAIHQYLVDAFVVSRPDGSQVVTLSQADFPYRMMVESMNEGAATLIRDGTIFYGNPRLAKMLEVEPDKLVGLEFQDFIHPDQKERFMAFLGQAEHSSDRQQFELHTTHASSLPVQLSMYRLTGDLAGAVSIIATDMTERLEAERKIRSLLSELTMAEQDERQRISEVLHDDLQQRLFAIKAQLSFLQDPEPPPDNNSMQQELELIQSWLSDTINIARNLSVDLSPMILKDEGLAEAIVWLSSQMKRRYGLEVDLQTQYDLRGMDKSLRMLIFQAVRELLFNVVKHAGRLQATVSLQHDGDHSLVIVSDEGIGFSVEDVLYDHGFSHGLLLIRDRLSLIDCQMEIESAPGKGSRVVIRIPDGIHHTAA